MTPAPEAMAPDLEVRSIEEAEAILTEMALALTPANPNRGQLANTITEGLLSQPVLVDRPHLNATLPAAEEQLRKAQARYRALVEQIPAITFMAPLDGSVSELYVSPQIETMLGFTAEEWLSNPILWYQQLHPDDKERWQDDFARTLNAGEHFRSDYRFISRDGRTVWVHGEAKVITDEQGQPLFLQGVAFDVTDRMEALEALERQNAALASARDAAMEASRAKSAFLANMSHELRTPLHAIIGFAEMLQEDAADAGHETFLPDLNKITGSARHLVGLISNILDLSKIEAGKMDLFLEDFPLSAVIEDVFATVLPLTTESNNALEVRCGDLGAIHADSTKVRQVLFNLLSNANKFTENGSIVLDGERVQTPSGEVIRLRISDTGIGIAPHQKEKLFQSFTQADDSTTRRYGGTGLGLAICHRFCQMMGGTIGVQSELGKGSTFSVQLPVQVTQTEQSLESTLTVEVSGPATAARTEDVPAVLVVSQDEQMMGLMEKFLSREGLRIVTAPDAAEGIPLARMVQPAAIILDVAIPDMAGWSALTALKADAATADVPVILFTREGDSNQGCPLGVTDYLTKPIDWSRLSRVLGEFSAEKPSPRVLVIDDEEDNRALLCRAAGQHGWQVSEAANGWQGLRAVVEAPPDLILLDLMMPEMDGFEFLRLVRTSQAGKSIPVVVVTARELTTEDRRRLSSSVQKLLQKGSFGREQLFGEIESLVTAHVGRAKPRAEPPAVEVAAPAQPVAPSALHELRHRLELAEAERDEAVAQLLAADARIGEPEAPDREDLKRELEQARQQLREQRQTVELLQAEGEDALILQREAEEMRQELARLRSERDAAIAQARDAGKPDDVGVALRQLQQELELLRREPARPKKRRKPKPVADEPPAEVAPKAAAPKEEALPGDWYVNFQDQLGQMHTLRGSTADVNEWVAKGLVNPVRVQVSRSQDGPFLPLICVEDFSDLAPNVAPVEAQALHPQPDANRAWTLAALRPRMPEWVTWVLMMVVAVGGAMAVGKLLW